MNLSFFVRCNPPTVTSQQKGAFAPRGGGVRFFKKKAVKNAENSLYALLLPHRPAVAFAGPICLVVHFRYAWRKSEKKSRVKAFREYPIETRPDCSNLIKSLEDVMTTLGYWNDDGQISSLSITKHYSDEPGIGINITQCLALTRSGQLTNP